MKKTRFLVFIFTAFLFAGKIFAQEHLVPLISNPIQAADAAQFANQRSALVVATDTIVMPTAGFRDKFDYNSHRPDTTLWELDTVYLNRHYPPGVFINRTWAMSPINLGVCTFDGLKWNGAPYDTAASPSGTGRCDELMTRPIDLSRKKITDTTFTTLTVGDSVYLNFWYQAGGRGYMPGTQDSILLDFNIPAWNTPPYDGFNMNWKNIWFHLGYNAGSDTSFHLVQIKLDSAAYFTPGFRFRFHNYASMCGSNDHWHIDDVFIRPGASINDTIINEASFVYAMPSFIKDFQAMPASHYKVNLNMISQVGISIRNNSNAARNVAYSYQVFDTPAYTYAGGSATLLPFAQIGYSNVPTHASPLVYPANFSAGFADPGTDTGFIIIRHKLVDGARVDSADFRQAFYNYYAYDDGSAEVGYGVYGQYSQLAYKFTMAGDIADTLVGIQMYFLPVLDVPNLRQREFTLKVWADGGNQPGTLLYAKPHQSPDYVFGGTDGTPNRFLTYAVDSSVIRFNPGQTYYIGWEQQAIDRLYIGFDFNTDHSDKIFYNTTGNWSPSIFDGSLMMRPVFGKLYPQGQDQSGITEHVSGKTFSVYPNPANEMITIAGLPSETQNVLVSLFDISGREVIAAQQINSNGTLDVSYLSAGAYFVQLRTKNGELMGTQRLIISR
ncbi:MAG: T9SS type A sorting domain-containing protein [Bacteroidia bacterium]